jgi:acetyl-CoA carboxylase biotin carboxyl carrier protein
MASDETPPPERRKSATEPFDTRLVRRLADILNEADLTEVEVERGDLRIRVVRQPAVGMAAPIIAPVALPGAAAPMAAPTTSAGVASEDVAAVSVPKGEVVNSPMVGTAYLSAQPGAAPFVRIGDRVSEGQTLLIVEAMKTMNPIPAPRAGTILEVLVENGQPVEYGEPLAVIG